MINRQNYEAFFLLYIDGELSLSDRQAVELFVRENADLADELALFQQMQLPAEQLAFADKLSLYRFEAEDIHAANYEERFLLYVDNELDASAREKVEVFVLQNPGVQDHFTLLKQTRLPLETIVFQDKNSLYRREEKKPVVYFNWQRLAVAAVFTALAISVWMLLPRERVVQTLAQQVSVNKILDQQHTMIAPGKETTASLPGVKNNTADPVIKNKTGNGVQTQPMVNPVPEQDNLLAQNTIPQVIDTKPETVVPAVTNPVETGHAVIERPITENTSVSGAEPVKNSGPSDEMLNPVAQPAVYKELDTDDEKKSLYLGSLEINKDKLRGFFRKAGNLLRSKAKQEEENNRSETSTPTNRRVLP